MAILPVGMTHVTLVRPPILFPKYCPSGTPSPTPPLGMAYLAGMLRAEGHGVTCVDAPGLAFKRVENCASDPGMFTVGLTLPQIVERIPRDTRVIGLTCMFSYDWFHVIELIRAIRARFPSQFIVLGGEHAT